MIVWTGLRQPEGRQRVDKGNKGGEEVMERFEEVRWKMHLNIPRNSNALVLTSAALHSFREEKRAGCSSLYPDLPVMKSTTQPMHRMLRTGEDYLE
jgi:hypothetical protein